MPKPRLLDLFCGAGGATKGYQRAGFYVVGVDIKPQPRYCGDEFYQADAMTYPLEGFDAIHASPPCQAYSVTRTLHDTEYPQLVEDVRERLLAAGVPFVIENVPGAPLRDRVVMCGSAFGLGVRRHRWFEIHGVPLFLALSCRHKEQPAPLDVTGTGGPGGRHRKPSSLQQGRDAMGIDWMARAELSESIPPAYTQFIGKQLMAVLA